MTIPANIQQAAAPWGAEAVYVCFGTEGGPYTGVDATHGLPVNVVAGSSGNAAASATGAAVPANADYQGVNVGGTLRGQTAVNPSGTIYAAQTDLSSVGGTSLAFGQANMAGSIPVVIASNQSAIPASQSGTWTVQQGGSNWSVNVAQIGGSALAFGQAVMASSIPVVIASNQAVFPVTPAASTGNAGTTRLTRNLGAATLVLAGANTLYGIEGTNTLAAITWLQVFDASSAGSVTLGTTVPVFETNMAANTGVARPVLGPVGIKFTNGIVIAATTTEFGNTAVANGCNANLITAV
jgi:hypothetical protein